MILKTIKKILVKRLAKELKKAIAADTIQAAIEPFDGCKNIAGLGGQGFNFYYIEWKELMTQSRDYYMYTGYKRTCPQAIVESLFFEYFGPLEAWCDNNCTSPYYLWSDKSGVYRSFTSKMDDTLWSLTFDNKMPTMKEIYQITDNHS